jgi:hypothetical protein
LSDQGVAVSQAVLLGTIYLAFISLGLPDSVLGVAWPAMRSSLGQPLESAGMVTRVRHQIPFSPVFDPTNLTKSST